MIDIVIYIILGLLCGISMGSIGIGAGLISVPLLIYYGLNIHQAVAVAMVMQLFPQSAPGVYNYRKYILWRPTIFVIVGSMLGIWVGSYITSKHMIPDYILYRILTVFLLFASLYFYKKHWYPHHKYDIIE